MITEYTDCTELMRLIAEQKIKPSALKSFLRKQGIIFTATNAGILSKDAYTVFLGGKEMEYITRMIVYEGNYEKSTLINAKMKQAPNEGDVIDYFSDELNSYRSGGIQGYTVSSLPAMGILCCLTFLIEENSLERIDLFKRKLVIYEL